MTDAKESRMPTPWKSVQPSRSVDISDWISPDPIVLCIDYISSHHEKPYCRNQDIHSGPLRLEPMFLYQTLVDTGQI